jgi:hypothetical protein
VVQRRGCQQKVSKPKLDSPRTLRRSNCPFIRLGGTEAAGGPIRCGWGTGRRWLRGAGPPHGAHRATVRNRRPFALFEFGDEGYKIAFRCEQEKLINVQLQSALKDRILQCWLFLVYH